MKALVGAFNQEKALVGAFSVIVKLRRLIVCSSSRDTSHGPFLRDGGGCPRRVAGEPPLRVGLWHAASRVWSLEAGVWTWGWRGRAATSGHTHLLTRVPATSGQAVGGRGIFLRQIFILGWMNLRIHHFLKLSNILNNNWDLLCRHS